MRRNPLLMTVMGNPGRRYRSNPFILIDSATNKIIRTWRGSMMDRKPFDWARDAARRLGRSVFIVAHPYVPPSFRAGVEVSPLFYFGGPYQMVHPDGTMGRGPEGGIKRNPGFLPAVAGGIAGSMVANALSNPGTSGRWAVVVTTPQGERKYLTMTMSPATGSQRWWFGPHAMAYTWETEARAWEVMDHVSPSTGGLVPDVEPFWSKFSNNPPRTRKGAENALDKAIERAWAQCMSGVQVPIMDIPRIFRDIKLEMAGGADLETAVRAVGGRYRVNRNPLGFSRMKMCEHGAASQRRCPHCRVMQRRGIPRMKACNHGFFQGCKRCHPPKAAVKMNPGRARKTSMPIEKFAALVKAQRDPSLWRDFVAKCKAYHKWSHGTWPKRVLVEAVRKPGMKGMWITFDMGREPEKTYVMPKGTKRKGAWKHPWERMPQLRGDAEAGFILTKLGKGNRLTDFLHGN